MYKKLTIVLALSAILTGFTVASEAATSSANDKPRCKPGQVAKMDARTGTWACKPLVIQAHPTANSSSSMPTTPMKPTKMKVSTPARAYPDLIIMDIMKVQGFDNRFQVRVQNIGKATATGAVLLGEDTTGLGGGGTKPIPTLKPMSFSAIIFDVPSANVDHGDRIKFFADAYQKVHESNEGNNIKFFTVP
jgi:hypothetical protein